MKTKIVDAETIVDTPRKAIEQSIRIISIEELRSLAERLFKDPFHPWSEPFHRFIDENAGNTFYHAVTKEQIGLVYCRATDHGIWLIPEVGVGIMQDLALKVMRRLVDPR